MASRFTLLLMTSTAVLLCGSLGCGAAPMGGTVVGGSATIQTTGTGNLIINQTSQNAIINWNTFNIGTGETVQFIQPNSSSVVLDRVTGGLGASTISGTLTANGQVFLINPYGVLIGRGGVINTGGFLATTSGIKNSDFIAGRYNFTTPGRPNDRSSTRAA
jgi:filamentous hemagglutinin family protein